LEPLEEGDLVPVEEGDLVPVEQVSLPQTQAPAAMGTPQWGGFAAPARPRMSVSPLAIFLGCLTLALSGYAGYEGAQKINAVATLMDRGGAPLSLVLLLLLRLLQIPAALALLIGWAGILARQSWGAMVGVIGAAVYFGASWAWIPFVHPGLGVALGVAQRRTIPRTMDVILDTTFDIGIHLAVPAALAITCAQFDVLAWRRKEWPMLLILLAAGAVGWSLYALSTSMSAVDGMLAMIDMADKFGGADRLTLRFWSSLLLRIGCLLAALALVVAAIGLFFKQSWSLQTALFAAIAYLACTLIMLVMAFATSGGNAQITGAAALFILAHLTKEVLPPGLITAWALWTQQNDDW
jgi:hypothetical protein